MHRFLVIMFTLLVCMSCSVSSYKKEEGGDEEKIATKEEVNSSQKTIIVDPPKSELCAKYECRGETRIKLRTGEGGIFDRTFTWFDPVIQDNVISILPGEELLIEVDEKDGVINNLKLVNENTNAEKTFIFKLTQKEKSTEMILTVKNPLKGTVKYSLAMMNFEGRLFKTASCPVLPLGESTEKWSHPIVQLLITDLKRLKITESAKCE